MIRAAFYLRVSSKEQTPENHERELRQWAGRRTRACEGREEAEEA